MNFEKNYIYNSSLFTWPVATTITRAPNPETPVYQNKTALIYCSASYDLSLDLVYVWTFSGKILDLQRNGHYELVYSVYIFQI